MRNLWLRSQEIDSICRGKNFDCLQPTEVRAMSFCFRSLAGDLVSSFGFFCELGAQTDNYVFDGFPIRPLKEGTG
jgi:hypothetical protein